MKLLVTGGAGFIGSEFVRQGVKKGYKIVVVDKLTYSGDLERLREGSGNKTNNGGKRKGVFYKADIGNKAQMEAVFKKEKPEIVINFAAETHVDRSIQDAYPFIETNVGGAQILLDAARKYKIEKFIHISTDEVYGEIKKGKFLESSPYAPNSPYSASKAAADLLIRSYIRTYDLPAIIVRPCNNYGPWQYPEKLIPVIIHKALRNKNIPVYGKGLNRREWLHVSDCAKAIFLILNRGRVGEIYNVGSDTEKRNIDVARGILKILNKPEGLIEFVRDRPGHDWRYSLNSSKINKLGWVPEAGFEAGIRKTVTWYMQNPDWLAGKVRHLRNYWKKVYK